MPRPSNAAGVAPRVAGARPVGLGRPVRFTGGGAGPLVVRSLSRRLAHRVASGPGTDTDRRNTGCDAGGPDRGATGATADGGGSRAAGPREQPWHPARKVGAAGGGPHARL